LTEAIPLEELPNSPQYHLLSWPRYSEDLANNRLEELKAHSVDALIPEGPVRRGELFFLGKGHVGLVVKALYSGSICALKIRRTDADRDSMLREARNQALANRAGVGPTLYDASDDFIVMELIEGEYLPEWISSKELSNSQVERVFRVLLEKSYRLDEIGLDHGELGRPKRHVIITDEGPRIIDFESASTERRPSNLTSIGQFLFINPRMREHTDEHMELPERDVIIGVFRSYKKRRTRGTYREILTALGLS